MILVIKASAMVDALVDEPANPELLAFSADRELHAPSLLDYEVASALRGHALAGRLADERLADAVGDFASLRIDRYPLSTMMRAVLDTRDSFTIYDAAYVVLAQTLQAPLVTADVTLAEARRMGVDVRVLRLHQ